MPTTDLTTHVDLPDWTARWISPVEADPARDDRGAYLLRRSFEIHAGVQQATLHATALGVYEAFVNGVRVGDHELAPGSTSYQRTLYAQSYDVSELLVTGANHLEILLSDGWYRGRNGGLQHREVWGDVTGALVELHIRTEGGRTTIGTDASWTSEPSRIVRADLMTGQTTDYSRAPQPSSPVQVDVVSAPRPTRSPAPPVRRVTTLPVRNAMPLRAGVTIVDFGQNISGWARLSDLGPEGSLTELTYGEHVDPDGDLTTAHLDVHTPQGQHVPCHQVDRVVAGPTPQTFEPRHTIHGFRYIRVSHPGRPLDLAHLAAVVVHTDLTPTSSFRCNDPDLNALHSMASWTFRANAVDVPTDCPTRERAAWTGDFQVYAPLAATMFDISGFADKWLASLRDDQFDDGCLPMYAPDADRMAVNPEHPQRMGGGSAGWGDAAVAVPWAIYRHYGDVRVLEDNWDLMDRWVNFALCAAREHRHASRAGTEAAPHERYLWDGTFHFGEWLEPRPASSGEVDLAAAYKTLVEVDKGEVGTAYLYRSTCQLSHAATVLGRHDRARELERTAAAVRDAWLTEYLDTATGRTRTDTQASYVRALRFGLLPEEQGTPAVDRLVELVAAADGHLSTGFLSTGMLLPVLADHGRADVAFALLQQTGTPSWRGMLERGATTFWENWEGVDADGVVRPGSLNHYSKGAAMRFLYTHVLGMRQATGSVGWREVEIRPFVGGGLKYADGHLDTPAGRLEVAWELDGDLFLLTVVVPNAMTAFSTLPDGSHHLLEPGRHDLRSRMPRAHDTIRSLPQ